ncbi:uncharacterized protein EDB93DRAFT_1247160 [Suillus bovinus]|uniref:uncharacterized protein n=1 Tax=Suillus bovinus TaxID=48563 RepID=UPI001B881572|nr:uncharacterized protein EDB93DRAFT_1247160 [Suillus bovinus]KAG2156452.1 hypothetical protein EDB93DRAFT_1247160 [Suillus bovinus]
MSEICEKIARQTLECANVVVHYSDMKSFYFASTVFDETEATIQRHNEVLDNLIQQFRDKMALTNTETVHRIAEDQDINGMEYVRGAGRNTAKNCLPGTREDILSDIKCWIRSTGEDEPRILWLSGTAGKGKSAIAHTIANWSHERGGMRACFCFDHTREAERRHEKIFTTIARDLADCDITMRRALARAVRDDNELKHTIDVSRQWQELVVGPMREASKAITAPVQIIIDALDESGDAPAELPANARIIIISRPLQDIRDALDASHVRHISMDDIPPASTHNDIQLYISKRLAGLRNFNDAHFNTLTEKSDGLFEWARLAYPLLNLPPLVNSILRIDARDRPLVATDVIDNHHATPRTVIIAWEGSTFLHGTPEGLSHHLQHSLAISNEPTIILKKVYLLTAKLSYGGMMYIRATSVNSLHFCPIGLTILIEHGHDGVPEPVVQRKKLQLLPRSVLAAEENSTTPLEEEPESAPTAMSEDCDFTAMLKTELDKVHGFQKRKTAELSCRIRDAEYDVQRLVAQESPSQSSSEPSPVHPSDPESHQARPSDYGPDEGSDDDDDD